MLNARYFGWFFTFVGLISAPGFSMPVCSLAELNRPAPAAMHCFLSELGEVIELEEGEVLLGWTLEEVDFLKTPYETFVKETKARLAKQAQKLKNKENLTRGGIRLKVFYIDGFDKPYVGTLVSKVVPKGEAVERTTMTFFYSRRFEHEPTAAEKADVKTVGEKKLQEFVKWTGKKRTSFTEPSEPEVKGLDQSWWEVLVSVRTK